MRENVRMKQQPFQLSLGVKQASAVLAAAFLILGAAFAVGLGVGRKSSAPAPAAAPRDALARLDEPLAAKEEPPPELKAHQALTDSRSIDKTMPVPAVNAAARPAPPAPRPEEKAAPEQEIVMPPAIAAPGPAKQPTSTATQPLSPLRGAREPGGSTSTAAPTPTPTANTSAAATPTRPATAAPTSRAATRSHPPRRVAEETKTAAPRTAATGKGAYTIQIASVQARTDAERAARQVAGRSPRIVAADIPGKGRWYRVQIGSYETRESARLALLSMSGVHGIVTPAR